MIVVFSKDNCPMCNQAKSLLAVKGHTFTEVNLGAEGMRETFMENYPGVKTVPYVVVDGKPIGGYSELVEYLNGNTQQFLVE